MERERDREESWRERESASLSVNFIGLNGGDLIEVLLVNQVHGALCHAKNEFVSQLQLPSLPIIRVGLATPKPNSKP